MMAHHLRRQPNTGAYPGGAQGARAPPLISIVVIFQPIILYTINRLLARVCAVNNGLIKIVAHCVACCH